MKSNEFFYTVLFLFQLKKIPLQLVTGLQRLRGQLKMLVVQRCHVGVEMNTRLLDNIEDVVVRCCGDESTSFAWNSLKELDLSNNSISKLGDSLVSERIPYVFCAVQYYGREDARRRKLGLVSEFCSRGGKHLVAKFKG